jgi:hypothetical protein
VISIEAVFIVLTCKFELVTGDFSMNTLICYKILIK